MTYNSESVRKAVDLIAEQEDRLEKMRFLRNEIPREFIKRYLKPSDLVLDAGGGAGINAILMARVCTKVTLVDISPTVLKLAEDNIRRAGVAEVVDIVEADITDLGCFEDAQFSFIVCVGGALSLVLDKRHQALCKLVRVARSGSVLILGFDSKYGAIRHLLRYEDDLINDAVAMHATNEWSAVNSGAAKSHLYTVAEATELITAAGCEILEVASTPTAINSLDEKKYHEATKWAQLKALELKLCTVPELLGIGSHLLCVARKA